MDRYDYWFDANGKFHRISEMDNSYIQNCLKQIKKVQKTWLDVKPEDLCLKDLGEINRPLSKAWFAFDGEKYIEVLSEELENRS